MTNHPNRAVRIRVPELEPHCGSWIVVSLKTGLAVYETPNRNIAESVNPRTHVLYTASQWLAKINADIKARAQA